MTTPEGRVKKNIRRVLDSFGVYYLMPVQFGMGAAGLDFHCVVRVNYHVGLMWERVPIAFFIEAKKPNGVPTDRQAQFAIDRKAQQNARTFVIDDDPSIKHVGGGLEELTKWLEKIEAHNERTHQYLLNSSSRASSADADSGV